MKYSKLFATVRQLGHNRKLTAIIARLLLGVDTLDGLAELGVITHSEYRRIEEAMPKAQKLIKCGQELMVERYGGGQRHACPACDCRRLWGIHSIVWTNGTPPKDKLCPNKVPTSVS